MEWLYLQCDIAMLKWAIPALRTRSWFLTFCIGFLVGFCWSDSLCAQSDSKLSPNDMPWLDSKSGVILPVEFGDRQSARSTLRAEIPDAVVTGAPRRGGTVTRSWMNWDWFGAWPWLWPALQFVFYALLILVVGLAAYFGYRYYRRDRELLRNERLDERLSTRTVEESMQQLSFDVDLSKGNFCEAAEKAYQSGDLRSAMIFLFSYVLVSLDQMGHIRLRKGKTNREYLREIQGERRLAKFYQRVMVPFEETFFGDYQLDPNDFENCWSQLGQFQRDVVQGSGGTYV